MEKSSAASIDARAFWRAALEWQLELGADEAIGESPVDRTAEPAPTQKRRAPAAVAAPAPDSQKDAEALAKAAQNLYALRDALLAFDGSSLKAGARNTVFADGNPRADLMVMGEAPGRDEDAQGLPFVGRSGQLLDRMLAAIGRDRRAEDPAKSAYISNVIPYRPLQNRTPDDREVAMLLPFALRHVALAKPAALLCLGNAPAKHLMGAANGITKFRGEWRELELDGAKIPALATFHPAYLLRSPDMKRHAWRDLLALEERLAALSGGSS